MSPSLDVYHILRYLGYDGQVFVGHDPDVDGEYIVLRDTGGNANPRYLRDEFRIQIMCKTEREDYLAGYNLLTEIKNLLLGLWTYTVEEVETPVGRGKRIADKIYVEFVERDTEVTDVISATDYIRFLLVSDVSLISQDENNRYMFTINFRIMREEKQDTGNRITIS